MTPLQPDSPTNEAHRLLPTWGEASWLILCLAILTWKLLLPGFIGMGDNGDFGKVAGPLCLGSADPGRGTFFSPLYLRGSPYCYNPRVPTSELVLGGLASLVEQTAGDRTRFDIRWLGAIHGLIFLAFYHAVLMLLRPLSGVVRFTLALLALWIFTDSSTLAYLNSFYSDVPALLGGLAAAVLAAHLLAVRRLAPAPLLLFGLAALLFVTSKAQHSVFGPLPAGLAMVCGRRARDRRTRIAGYATGAALLLASGWILGSTPGWYEAQSRFNLIFLKIAGNSPSPVRDLAELGLDTGDARYIGLHSFVPGGPVENPTWVDNFRIRSGYRQVLTFYLRHPPRAFAILEGDLEQQSWQRRPAGLSNFQKRAGRPEGATATGLSSWSALRTWASRVWPAHIVVWLILCPPAALWFARRDASRRRRALAWTIAGVCLVACGEFAIASLADACETVRHLMMFQVFTDISLFLGMVYAASVLDAACPPSFRKRALAVALAGLTMFAAIIVKAEVLPGTADDASPAIVYSGSWLAGAFRPAFDGTLTYSDETGAMARFSFKGTEMQYTYTKALNRGISLVTIDGIPRGAIDLYDPHVVWQARTVFGGLKPGLHRAEIQVLGRRNAASSGDYIDIDALTGR